MDTIDNMLNWPLFTISDTQTTLGSLLVVIIVVIASLLLGRIAPYFNIPVA